jgi:hypothetical protein
VEPLTLPMAVVPSPPAVVPRYTLYPVIAAPPLDDGAFHFSVTWVFPAVATRFCGADGTVGTVTVTVVG